jgi:hypothetical protein|tara:strand:+ start:20 stop:214 length:195 start_codon:yes stop_codon:yes gene_type:complete
METKIYHIYVKKQCIYSNLTEASFKKTWKQLNNMVGIIKTDYDTKDLSYEELVVNREEIANSSY